MTSRNQETAGAQAARIVGACPVLPERYFCDKAFDTSRAVMSTIWIMRS